MKKEKKKIILFFIILVCIILFIINFIKYDFLQEDLLFFHFLNFNNYSQNKLAEEKEYTNKEEKNTKTIKFNVQYKDTDFKALNLTQTIDNKTLVYEKIAPGTNGNFDILLSCNQNMNYKIGFESKNEKPTNLQFYTSKEEKKYNTLEKLGESLVGTIFKLEKKRITVYWNWEYETNKINDEKDTEEAKKIKEYNFIIYVQGY